MWGLGVGGQSGRTRTLRENLAFPTLSEAGRPQSQPAVMIFGFASQDTTRVSFAATLPLSAPSEWGTHP